MASAPPPPLEHWLRSPEVPGAIPKWVISGCGVCRSIEDQAGFGDPVGSNLVTVGASAMLGDRQRPAHPAIVAGAAHQDDRVGAREDVALADRLREQLVKHHLGCRVEVNTSNLTMIVRIPGHFVRMGAE